MNIYSKLQAARVQLQGMKITKSGENKFAGYKYMELSDFIPAINTIFAEKGLCGVVSFTAENATLTIHDADSHDTVVFASPMSTAALKGCHDVQNLGAVQTYLRRYLYVMALEIVEHDALDGTTGKAEPAPKEFKHDPKILKTLIGSKTLEDLAVAWNAIPVGLRHEYSQAKDAQKAAIGGGNA